MIDSIFSSELPEGETEESFRSQFNNWIELKNNTLEFYPLPLAKYDIFYSLSLDFTILPTPLPQLIDNLVAVYETAVNKRIQEECTAAGFDDISTACAYASTSNPLQSVSITFVNWRAAVWLYCKNELEKVHSGAVPIPELSTYISSLPIREGDSPK